MLELILETFGIPNRRRTGSWKTTETIGGVIKIEGSRLSETIKKRFKNRLRSRTRFFTLFYSILAPFWFLNSFLSSNRVPKWTPKLPKSTYNQRKSGPGTAPGPPREAHGARLAPGPHFGMILDAFWMDFWWCREVFLWILMIWEFVFDVFFRSISE